MAAELLTPLQVAVAEHAAQCDRLCRDSATIPPLRMGCKVLSTTLPITFTEVLYHAKN